MSGAPDYLVHLKTESTRFAKVLADADAQTPVPSCPGWSVGDLVWHLAEVQWFWTALVDHDATDPDQVEGERPDRPVDHGALRHLGKQTSKRLRHTLRARAADAPVWTWSEDHTVGFVRRRQAHEALIHRVDAELATGSRTPMDAALSADGVDEVLRVMYDGAPPWAELRLDETSTVRFRADDVDRSWFATCGRYRGTSPSGKDHDEPTIVVADVDPGRESAATVTAAAADLDCWLWGRDPVGDVRLSGDVDTLAALHTVIGRGLH